MYELSDLFEIETCLLCHNLNQNQITTVKLTNDLWHCVFNIFGLYINLSQCTVYMVLQYMYKKKLKFSLTTLLTLSIILRFVELNI